jgi:RpiR family transcriptional regulator, carbohydrate utilization regulator
MREKSCIYEIHDRRAGMSDKEGKVADFILAAPRDAVRPSIEELAERIGVSESTLFRFVRKLGYGGYQEFRIALATETAAPNAMFYDAPVEAEDGETAVNVVFRTAIAALELTQKSLDRAQLDRAAAFVAGARLVLFLGLGGSGLVAKDACHKLIRAGVPCSAPEDFHLQLMAASQARQGDIALIVSHTGANKDALAIADEVKRAGAPLVAVTTNPRCPLAKLADVVLVATAPSSPYVSEAFSARIAQLAIVDALYVQVMERRGEAGARDLGRMRAAIAKRRT